MRKKIIVVLIGLALFPVLMADDCNEGPCKLKNVDATFAVISNNQCYVESSDTNEIIFEDNPFDFNLTSTMVLGALSTSTNLTLMNFNVTQTSSVSVSKKTPFVGDPPIFNFNEDNCAAKIYRHNIHIKGITLKNYDLDYGVCIYAKGVVLENVAFENITPGKAIKLFDGASVILKDATFTGNQKNLDAVPNGAYIIINPSTSNVCNAAWPKVGESCINKSIDETVYKAFDDYISNKELLSTTVCGSEGVLSQTGCVCKDDHKADPDKSTLDCVYCPGTDKMIKDGKCTCTDTSLTLSIDSKTCSNPCPLPNEVSKDGACVCKSGDAGNYGRYYFEGMSNEEVKKNPCVSCGPNTDSSNGVYCTCFLNYHRDLKGACVANTADAATECGTNASRTGNACQCNTCSAYTWSWKDASGNVNQAALDAGPSCVQNTNTCTPTLDCDAMGKQHNKKLVLSADGLSCIEATSGAGGGDCQLNPNAGTTALQAMFPFIAILASSIGVRLIKKKR